MITYPDVLSILGTITQITNFRGFDMLRISSLKLIMAGLVITLFVVSGCTQNQNSPASAVEEYYRALVARDTDRISTLSCAAWEATAQDELASLTAVEVSLEELSCQKVGEDGEIILVSCNGVIIANYGNEVLEIDLSDSNYQVVEEAGEWRMCGYR